MDIPHALLETIINKMTLVYKMDMLYLKLIQEPFYGHALLYLKKFKLKIAK